MTSHIDGVKVNAVVIDEHFARRAIAVDVDGCLASYIGWTGFETIGHLREDIAAAVRREAADGARIIIHTARIFTYSPGPAAQEQEVIPEALKILREWLDSNDLPYEIWTGRGKPTADEYWDDKAVCVNCPACQRRHKIGIINNKGAMV